MLTFGGASIPPRAARAEADLGGAPLDSLSAHEARAPFVAIRTPCGGACSRHAVKSPEIVLAHRPPGDYGSSSAELVGPLAPWQDGMSESGQNLTGVWNGQYDYAFGYEPVGFMATLIEAGAGFSGGVSETAPDRSGAPVDLFAMIDGRREGHSVHFTKTYDGSGGWEHVVEYEGTLSADGNEIEGEWRVPGAMNGRFMMIRPDRNIQTTDQRIVEKV